MANLKSSKKQAKQNVKRRSINLARRSSIKTAMKHVVAAVEAGDIDKAKELMKKAEAQLARAKSKGLLHRRTASRKISRLAKKVSQKKK